MLYLRPLPAAAAAAAKSLQSCPTLCNPIDGSPTGCAVPGILQVRILEWAAISFSNAWKWKESEVAQSCLTLHNSMDCSLPDSSVHWIFQARVLEWGAIAWVPAKLLQSCPTLCDPVDCSPRGSSVHRILQARILEWVATPFSRGSSRPRDGTRISYISYIGRQVLYR